jgi:hypothetical protein
MSVKSGQAQRPAVSVVSRQEHLLDEVAASGSRIGAFESWEQTAGEVLPHLLAKRRGIDHYHRAHKLRRVLAQCERDHRAPSQAEHAPQCRDIGSKAIDRERARSPALAVSRQVHVDDLVRC